MWEHLIKCYEFILQELKIDGLLSALEFPSASLDSVSQELKEICLSLVVC